MNQQEKEQFISHLRHSLESMAYGDIIRATTGGSKMGAFILASCLIDYLAGYYSNWQSVKQNYIKFVNDFLPNYDAVKLYEDLRCKVVHNYSEGGSYVFTDNKSLIHLQRTVDGRIVLNLENFIDEVKKAMDKYFQRLEKEIDLLNKAQERLKKFNILGINPIEVQVRNPV